MVIRNIPKSVLDLSLCNVRLMVIFAWKAVFRFCPNGPKNIHGDPTYPTLRKFYENPCMRFPVILLTDTQADRGTDMTFAFYIYLHNRQKRKTNRSIYMFYAMYVIVSQSQQNIDRL